MRALGPLSIVIATLVAPAAHAQTEPPVTPAPVPYETVVTAATPLNGSGLPIDRVPANVQTATGAGIAKAQSLDLSQFMNTELGSVHVNDVQNNVLQPDLQYRGFLASPLLGAPQGLSVYWGGVRLNESFGDTINWDLIPTSAIRTLNLMPGSNPLFGMNTLGGAISIETKTGFSDPGTEVRLTGGSFARRQVGVQVGSHGERFGTYFAADFFKEDGWRPLSPSEAARALLSTSFRGEASTAELTLATAESDLQGNGPAPVQLLAQDRAAVFTTPDRTRNRLLLASLRGERTLALSTRLQGVVFYRRNRTLTANGDHADWARCADPTLTMFLCGADDAGGQSLVTAPSGQPVPFDAVQPYDAAQNETRTTQNGYGGTAQLAFERPAGSHENHLFVGASGDEGRAAFSSQSTLARLSAARDTLPTDIVVDDSRVQVDSVTRKLGLYASDTFALLPDLFLTASGRYNLATLTLADRLGDALSGHHVFQRFNPAGGVSYQPRPWLGAFAGYGESTRAPTALELTCASPTAPCRLPNSFLSDPPLAQVVARTFEAGVRGRVDALATSLTYALAAFRTTNDDDIIFIGTGPVVNLGYFDNVGRTRRQGIEASLTGRRVLGARAGRLEWALHYTRLDATFQTAFSSPSPNHPDADPTGRIDVPVGARLPGVPRHLGKVTVSWILANRLSIGFNLVANGGQVRRGDEANLLDPVPGFVIATLRAAWDISAAVSVFATLSNLFDTRYSTFSALGDPTTVLGPAYDNPRFDGPGAPRAGWLGLALRY